MPNSGLRFEGILETLALAWSISKMPKASWGPLYDISTAICFILHIKWLWPLWREPPRFLQQLGNSQFAGWYAMYQTCPPSAPNSLISYDGTTTMWYAHIRTYVLACASCVLFYKVCTGIRARFPHGLYSMISTPYNMMHRNIAGWSSIIWNTEKLNLLTSDSVAGCIYTQVMACYSIIASNGGIG